MGCLDGITDSMDMSLSKLGVGDGQGSLACCHPRGLKDLDMTGQLNNHNNKNSGHQLMLLFSNKMSCVTLGK